MQDQKMKARFIESMLLERAETEPRNGGRWLCCDDLLCILTSNMPISFNYDSALRILFTTAEGQISLADIERHLDQESDAKALGYRELIDASAATTSLTSAELRFVVRRFQMLMKSAPLGPTALVTTNDRVFGMVSMLAILSELNGGPSIGVFRTFSEGLDWLVRSDPPAM
jgi:hypothetical protein